MEHFWNGFEKQAAFKDVAKKALHTIKNTAFKDKAKKSLGTAKDVAKKSLGAVKDTVVAPFKFVKDVGEAAGHINKATEFGSEAASRASAAIPQVQAKVNEALPQIQAGLDKVTTKGLKYLKRGGLGALGIYGASKAVHAPADIERYKYYNQQRQLSKKQLNYLDKIEHGDKNED